MNPTITTMNNVIYYKSLKNNPVRNALINDLYHSFGPKVDGDKTFPDPKLNYAMVILDARECMGHETDIYTKDFKKNIEEFKRFIQKCTSKHAVLFSYHDFDTFLGEDNIRHPIVPIKTHESWPDDYDVYNTYALFGKCIPIDLATAVDYYTFLGFDWDWKKTAQFSEEVFLTDFVLAQEKFNPKMEFKAKFDGCIIEMSPEGYVTGVYVIGSLGTLRMDKSSKYLRALSCSGEVADLPIKLGNRIIRSEISSVVLCREKVPEFVDQDVSPFNYVDYFEDKEDEKGKMVVRRYNPDTLRNYSVRQDPIFPYEEDREMGLNTRTYVPPAYSRSYPYSKVLEDKRDFLKIEFEQKINENVLS